MLRAIRTSDGAMVEAWSQRESMGPFACPSCRRKVILRGGQKTLDHFAHTPAENCRLALGESEEHRRCKTEIWLSLREATHVADVILERNLTDVRADVSALISGFPVAIEVQLSNIQITEIVRRTKEYARLGIYVLWLAQWTPELDSGRYTPKPWERWVHAAYFGRVYYWVNQTTIVPYHFDPGHVHIEARSWTDAWGRKKSEPAYTRRSLQWKRPQRGPTLDLLTDFVAKDREWWKGGEIEVPLSKIYCDLRPAFWK